MADQLLGVLREVVAISTGIPRPSASTLFGGDELALIHSGDFEPIHPDYRQLLIPLLDTSDPAFNAVVNVSAIADPVKRAVSLEVVVQKHPQSKEAWLRLANSLIESGVYDQAEQAIAKVEEQDPWEWRIYWYRGRSLMAQGKPQEAQKIIDQVYFELPGEIAPKLALGLAAEQAKNYKLAIKMYDLVSRTDPNYVSAAFGLARCLCLSGNNQASRRKEAVTALERIPQASNLFTRARVEIARILLNSDISKPNPEELKAAAATIEALTLSGMDLYKLTQQILETALNLLTSQSIPNLANMRILGQPLQEKSLRIALEKALRDMAHLASGHEKTRLVDEANRVRPRTLV